VVAAHQSAPNAADVLASRLARVVQHRRESDARLSGAVRQRASRPVLARARLADNIARNAAARIGGPKGHAFKKHAGDFSPPFTDNNTFIAHIAGVMTNPATLYKQLADARCVYYSKGTLVIYNANAEDRGSAYPATQDYFNGMR